MRNVSKLNGVDENSYIYTYIDGTTGSPNMPSINAASDNNLGLANGELTENYDLTWNAVNEMWQSSVVNITQRKNYNSIQAAIDAAVAGDEIHVAAGTYAEPQIVINKNLTIVGAGVDDVIIARASGSGYFWSVSGAIDLTLKDLTITAFESTTTSFVAHLSGLNSATLENVKVIGQGKDYTTDGGAYYYTNPGN